MIRHSPVARCLPALLALLPLACGRLHGDQASHTPPAFELTAEEVRLARTLAEQHLISPVAPTSPGDKVVFTKVELLPDSQAETTQRQVLVTHYRYRNNEAILTHVDLNNLQVLSIEAVPHLPTPLAQEEFARAVELARADAQLAGFFADHGDNLRIEGKLSHAAPGDPDFGRRLVYLLFRTDADYLARPRVVVDLHSETVRVETPPPASPE